MKVWRVQHVHWGSTCINIYGREEDAKKRVANVFREDLLPGLEEHLGYYFGRPEHDEHIEKCFDVIRFIGAKLDTGDVWGAYDAWQNFMRWNVDYNPELPLWVEAGTVIVDAAEGAGPVENPFFPILPDPGRPAPKPIPDPRLRKARRR